MYSNFVRHSSTAKSIVVRAHLNPNASHLKPLVGVRHPVKQTECQASAKPGHHNEVVGKQESSAPHTNLPKTRVPCVAQRVEY